VPRIKFTEAKGRIKVEKYLYTHALLGGGCWKAAS